MPSSFRFHNQLANGCLHSTLEEYLEQEGGTAFLKSLKEALNQGIRQFVWDFQKLSLISSPGLAHLIDAVGLITEEFDGKIAVYGLLQHHMAVLEMASFFCFVTLADDEVQARKAVGA